MGKNIPANILELDRHFAYFIYEQGLPKLKKYMGRVISTLGCLLVNLFLMVGRTVLSVSSSYNLPGRWQDMPWTEVEHTVKHRFPQMNCQNH